MFDLLKYTADFCHLISFFVLIKNMREKKNCLGLSYRTQEIYLVVFLLRYSDVFFLPQKSLWNSFNKCTFTFATVYIIYLMRFQRPICVSYERLLDTFPHMMTIYPISLAVAFLLKDYSTLAKVYPVYAFIYDYTVILESVSILPQIYLMRKINEVEIITGTYIFLLGSYRGIYILSWQDNFMLTLLGYTDLLKEKLT